MPRGGGRKAAGWRTRWGCRLEAEVDGGGGFLDGALDVVGEVAEEVDLVVEPLLQLVDGDGVGFGSVVVEDAGVLVPEGDAGVDVAVGALPDDGGVEVFGHDDVVSPHEDLRILVYGASLADEEGVGGVEAAALDEVVDPVFQVDPLSFVLVCVAAAVELLVLWLHVGEVEGLLVDLLAV